MFAKFQTAFLWIFLALPGAGMTYELVTSTHRNVAHHLIHPTGEFAARFLIISMMATPLCLLLKGWRGPRWLMKNRRYFGVAAFAYALAHTALYLVDINSLERVISELGHLDIWTGWAAFLIFLPLAATSMDYAVRKMGSAWKTLHKWVYLAAVMTLVHWMALHNWSGVGPALVHFAPLVFLTVFRVWHVYSRKGK